MKRYFLGAALGSVLLCAPVMAQDAGQDAASVDVQTQPVAVPNDAAGPVSAAVEAAPAPNVVAPPVIDGPVEGFTYFHRTGATMADHQADLAACRPSVLAMVHREAGSDVVQSGSGVYTPVYVPQMPAGSAGAAAGAGIIALLAVAVVVEAEQRAAEVRDMHLNYENCMVARGWNVMLLDQEAGRPLDRLSAGRLATALEPMVGAATPAGTVRRQFNNDFRFSSPEDVGEMSLSLQIVDENYFGEREANDIMARNSREDRRRARERQERANARAEARLLLFQGRPGKGASPAEMSAIGEAAEGTAIIVMESRGPSVRLVNAGVQAEEGVDAILATPSGGLQYFTVSAGDWRLTSLSTSAPATSLCLGAPSFNVAAGEVVYAGAFAADGQPDLALESVREQLAARPDLAERLRAASYRNGGTFDCGGATFLSAFHVNDAPFEEGYTGVRERVVTTAD